MGLSVIMSRYAALLVGFACLSLTRASPIAVNQTATANQTDEMISGDCYIRECGCPGPYKHSWCTSSNARVQSPWCQENVGHCTGACHEDWCGSHPPSPPPPTPPAPPVAYHTPKIDDPDKANICYQTSYNDA